MQRPQYSQRRGSTHRGMPHSYHRDVQRSNSGPPPHQVQHAGPAPEEPEVPQGSNYEQVVRFLQDGWKKFDEGLHTTDKNVAVVYHTETEPNSKLKDFVPVNLDDLIKRRKQQQTPNHGTS